MDAYLSLAYLPPVEYFAKLVTYDRIFIEQHDNYVKQTYRNRCFIGGTEGRQTLTVPVEGNDGQKCPMKDVRISDHGHWRHLHWTAFESAYGHTPYFEFYRDYFEPFYNGQYRYLLDFDMGLLRLVCRLIDISPDIRLTEAYCKDVPEGARDFREAIHPKKDFRQADPEFRAEEYYQVFSSQHGFIPNLSIVDLLFNMGPDSVLVLQKCNVPYA